MGSAPNSKMHMHRTKSVIASRKREAVMGNMFSLCHLSSCTVETQFRFMARVGGWRYGGYNGQLVVNLSDQKANGSGRVKPTFKSVRTLLTNTSWRGGWITRCSAPTLCDRSMQLYWIHVYTIVFLTSWWTGSCSPASCRQVLPESLPPRVPIAWRFPMTWWFLLIRGWAIKLAHSYYLLCSGAFLLKTQSVSNSLACLYDICLKLTNSFARM